MTKNNDDLEEAFRCVFEQYARPVVIFFRNRGFSSEESRDLAQETFLGVYQGMKTFRREASVKTWLFRIARNLWSNTLRRHSTQKRSGQEVSFDELSDLGRKNAPDDDSVGVVVCAEEMGPLAGLLVAEELRQVRDAVMGLPADEQQLVLLRYFQDLKHSQIATVLGIPEGTVKSRLARARRSLKGMIGSQGSGFERLEDEAS